MPPRATRWSLCLALSLLASSAFGQGTQPASAPAAPASGPATSLAPPALAPPSTRTGSPEARSPKIALLLSAGASLASYGMLLGGAEIFFGARRTRGVSLAMLGLTGVVVAPSAGVIYAGGSGRLLFRCGLRLLAATSLVYGVVRLGEDAEAELLSTRAALFGGGAALVGLSLYDIVDAPFAVRRQQRALALVPLLSPQGFGVGAALRF